MTKILIVEDNEVNRDMLSRRLIRHDYEIIFALHGAEGVSKTLAEKPDLILMDMNLPVMDGWEATRQLKANPRTCKIPIIALTAHSMQGDKEKALSTGCDEYESKPIDFPSLLGKIESFIEKAKSEISESAFDLNISQLNPHIQKALFSHLRHELCTPMNAIIGYSEILLDELKQPDTDIYRDIDKILKSGNQLLELANKILDPTDFELNQDRSFDDFGAKIRLEMLTPLSTIIGYCDLLIEDADALFVPDLEHINIAAQKLLSMVNDIVNLAQQQLKAIDIEHIESNSTSALIQTAADTMHLLSQNNSVTSSAKLSGMILIIDDNETNCDLLSRQLERQGYTVAVATSGQQALQILQVIPYDLILLDIVMPGMSGLEVLAQLKIDPNWQNIPVIMISALDEIDSVVRCVEMGADDYLSKPFKPVLLRAKITACLEKKRLREQQVVQAPQLMDAALVPVMISRLSDGLIIYANTTAAATFALPVAQLCNRHIQSFLSHEDYSEIITVLQRNEAIINREFLVMNANGTQLWVIASLQPLTYNSEQTILTVLCDISDRKRAEDELRIAEQSYRSIFDNALQGIYQSTPDGQIVFVNKAMAMIYGFDNPIKMIETVNTLNYKLYVDIEQRQQFHYLLEVQGQVTGVEYQVYKYNGQTIWLSESARVVRDANGNTLYYEGIVEDITQRKLSEAALKRELEELRMEINQTKRAQEVAVTQPNYYQDNQDKQAKTTPTVLLVEDNEMNRDMLSRRLKRLGYEVLIAVDGQEGISIANSTYPDIILMDMSLPVLDGWEATKQLKANNKTKHIPIIALTAHAMSGDREKALNSGCDEYDTKPIEMSRLLNKITTLLNK
ncbi:response regulator receiver protein [Calothrix sp. NIES-4071]|nr:response regulator receiver protein [Calothrix sp. NIES-4071]BAZ55305.1 response regulator receiver protein [Calothrix sp. NIES-4105]